MTDEQLAGQQQPAVETPEVLDQPGAGDPKPSVVDGQEDGATPGTTAEPKVEEAAKGADPPKKASHNERRRKYHEALRQAADTATRNLEKIRGAGNGEAPKVDDFEDDSDYIAAKAVHAYETSQRKQRIAEAETEATEATKEHQSEAQRNWDNQVTAAKAQHGDFETVAYNAPISNEVAAMLQDSYMGAEVAYYLGKNPDQAQDISALGGMAAARELGRIEAKIEATEPKAPAVSKAPPPIDTVAGSGSPTGKAVADMDYQEYRKSQGFHPTQSTGLESN